MEVCFVWGGTGANVVSLQSLVRPWSAVVCTANAHIAVDECGAPERFTGCKLLTFPSTDGKLTPADLEAAQAGRGDEHHAQATVVSVTQSTECGTLYSAAELTAICETAHGFGMRVHLDGARLGNAVAALGCDVRALTVDAGVDVVSFGGTKNGMMYGEAVVFCDPALGADAKFIRKQATQLPSKMRFVAAQFEALLTDDLWIRNAGTPTRWPAAWPPRPATSRACTSCGSPRSTASSSASRPTRSRACRPNPSSGCGTRLRTRCAG